MATRRFLTMLALYGAAIAVPVAAQAPGLAMLNELERGAWQLRDRDGGATRSICLGDALQLVQLQHSGRTCSRYVIEDTPSSVTVHYSCPGAGYGHTTIRRETNRLVQVMTQGVSGGAPFSTSYEVRRTGACN